jgi:alpha-L-arabinofuranosidase
VGQNFVNVQPWNRAYDEAHHAFFPEVTAALREERPTVMRFPGGLFGNTFHWYQTIGPVAQRPPYDFRAMGRGLQPALTGADEFMKLIEPVPDCQALNIVNISRSKRIGDGTAEEAAAWVAYCNGRAQDTTTIGVDYLGKDWKTVGYWAGKRAENGHPAPYNVKYWELGNEINQAPDPDPNDPNNTEFLLTAEEYVERSRQFIAAMRKVDPAIKIGLVGWTDVLEATAKDGDRPSSKGGGPWLATVIPALKSQTDFFVFHHYNPVTPDISPERDVYPKAVLGYSEAIFVPRLARLVKVLKEKAPGMPVWVTEYNRVLSWQKGEQTVREQYNLLSGLAVADMLMAMIREPAVANADFFEFIGGMGTVFAGDGTSYLGTRYEWGQVVRSPSHWVFSLFSEPFRQSGGVILKPDVRCGSETVLGYTFPMFNAVAVSRKGNKQIDILLLNKNIDAAVECAITFPDIAGKVRSIAAVELNSWEPNSPTPLFDDNLRTQKVWIKGIEPPTVRGGTITGKLAPHSLVRYRISL